MILLDVDGVLAGSHQVLIGSLQSQGYDVSLDDITSWDFGRLREKTGFSTKKCIETLWDVWRNQSHLILPLDESTVAVTNQIIGKYQSEIVTANPIPAVKEWLSRVGITNRYFRISESKTEPDYAVLIEDNPTLKLNSHKLILRNQPWNQGVSGAIRFYHSKELMPLLDELAHKGVVRYR